MVRMVRSLGDRTFQPRYEVCAGEVVVARVLATETCIFEHYSASPWRCAAGPLGRRRGPALHLWVERFDRRGTEPFELFGSKFGPQFCQNLRKICQNSSEIVKFEGCWPFSKIFREMPINFHQNRWKIPWKLLKNSDFCRNFNRNLKKLIEFLLRFWIWSGAKDCKSCRSRKMLQNEYLDAKSASIQPRTSLLKICKNL